LDPPLLINLIGMPLHVDEQKIYLISVHFMGARSISQLLTLALELLTVVQSLKVDITATLIACMDNFHSVT